MLRGRGRCGFSDIRIGSLDRMTIATDLARESGSKTDPYCRDLVPKLTEREPEEMLKRITWLSESQRNNRGYGEFAPSASTCVRNWRAAPNKVDAMNAYKFSQTMQSSARSKDVETRVY
jgi:hypothetical protein